MLPAEMDQAATTAARRPKFCPECGGRVDEKDAFCGGCGHGIAESAAPAPPTLVAAPKLRKSKTRGDVSSMSEPPSRRAAWWSAALLGSFWPFFQEEGTVRGWRVWAAWAGTLAVVVCAAGLLRRASELGGAPLQGIGEAGVWGRALLWALAARFLLNLPLAGAAREEAPWLENRRQARLGGIGAAAVLLVAGLAYRDAHLAERRHLDGLRALGGAVRVEWTFSGEGPTRNAVADVKVPPVPASVSDALLTFEVLDEGGLSDWAADRTEHTWLAQQHRLDDRVNPSLLFEGSNRFAGVIRGRRHMYVIQLDGVAIHNTANNEAGRKGGR